MAMDLNWWDEKFDQVTSFSKEAKRGFTCVEVNGLLAKKNSEDHPNGQTASTFGSVSYQVERRFDEIINRAFNVKISQRSERKSFQGVAFVSGRLSIHDLQIHLQTVFVTHEFDIFRHF